MVSTLTASIKELEELKLSKWWKCHRQHITFGRYIVLMLKTMLNTAPPQKKKHNIEYTPTVWLVLFGI